MSFKRFNKLQTNIFRLILGHLFLSILPMYVLVYRKIDRRLDFNTILVFIFQYVFF